MALSSEHLTWSEDRKLGFLEALDAAAKAAEKFGREASIRGQFAIAVVMGQFATVMEKMGERIAEPPEERQ